MKLKFIIAFTLVIVASRGNSQVIVADHSIVERYSAIPQYYIDKVKQMWVSIAGESHSEAYRVGCELLETIDSRFQVNVKESGTPEPYTSSYLRISRATWGDYNYSTGWQYSYGEEDWFTNSTAVQRTRNGLLYCHQNGPALSVLGFGWCYDMTATNEPGGQYDPVYNVRWAGETESGPQGSLRWGLDAADQALTGNSVCVDTYLEATLGYINFCEENNIPTSILFTTGPIDNYGTYYLAEGESGYQQFLKTSRIREYVNSLEKAFLFDYADILAYNNNGVMNITTWIDNASLNHTFPIIADENMEGGYVAHIGNNGALRLAKALWWLLARIAGWDGISTNIVPVSSVTITAPQSQTLIDADNGYLQLTASVLPVNATNTTVSLTLVSGKNQASVSGNGLITAKSDGIVTVKALAKDGSGSEDRR
ncbi:MAG: Ig-like domain-containing protein [Bacteroidales bacterium]